MVRPDFLISCLMYADLIFVIFNYKGAAGVFYTYKFKFKISLLAHYRAGIVLEIGTEIKRKGNIGVLYFIIKQAAFIDYLSCRA